jgi:charged multivesicular body protein 1
LIFAPEVREKRKDYTVRKVEEMADLQNVLFNVKFTSKQLAKSSKKAEKGAEVERKKVASAMQKGNPEAAKIYAESSIRKKNESLTLLRLSARLDGAASRINTAIQMRMVTQAMGQTVKGMDKVLETMDPMKITGLMDHFEKQTGALDQNMEMVQSGMEGSEASTVPSSEVEAMLEQLGAEQNLNTREKMTNAQGTNLDPLLLEDEEMTARLNKLKNSTME